MVFIRIIALISALTSFVCIVPAEASSLYVAYNDNAGRSMLLDIDPLTGNIQSRTGIQRVSAIPGGTITEHFNFPLSGLTYGNGALFASYDDNAGRPMLLDIDPLTGNIQSRTGIQRVSAIPGGTITEQFNFPLTGLTFGNDALFASYDDNAGRPMLAEIDPRTGDILSRTGIQRVSAIPGGTITEHFNFPLTGLTYGNGNLFASYDDNAGRPMLLDIDPFTGDILSRTGIQRIFAVPGGTVTEPFMADITGITFVTAVPLPGSFAMFGLGLLLTVAIGKSRVIGDSVRKGAGLLEHAGV